MKNTTILLLILSSLCYSQSPVDSNNVSADSGFTVSGTVTNIQKGKTVYLALFASEEALKKTKDFYMKDYFDGKNLVGDTIHFSFNNVEPGEYVIASYQDINSDGKMNMGLFGPKEPYRIYRPNYGMFGPKFQKCKFKVTSDIDSAHIVLK